MKNQVMKNGDEKQRFLKRIIMGHDRY